MTDKTTATAVTEAAIAIPGYTAAAPASVTITLAASGNTITFYYTPNTDIEYTVHYYLIGTTDSVSKDKLVTGQTMASTVTETAIAISGYTAADPASVTIKLAAAGNAIVFYYTQDAAPAYIVTFDSQGGTEIPQQAVAPGGKLTRPASPARGGYDFLGWYTAASGGALWDFDVDTVNGDTTLYAQWAVSFSPRGPGNYWVPQPGRPAPVYTAAEIEPGNAVSHYRYLYGYPDNTMRPDNQITRAEVAAIFFRLSGDLNKNAAASNAFYDVSANAWYAQSVNFLASKGIVVGYPDGSYRPGQPITRAEFTTIISKYGNLSYAENYAFSDVARDHWAFAYIYSAYAKGWIVGYPDGTFRPNNPITRAEVVKIVNNMLGRKTAAGDIPTNAPVAADVLKSHWAYADIIEASVDHTCIFNATGYETWRTVNNQPAVHK